MLIAAIFVALFFLGILIYMQKKEISFTKRVLFSLLLGIIFGLIFKELTFFIEPIGKTFITLIKMIIIPLVFVSIINSFTKLENMQQLKSVGLRTLSLLIFTTAIASTIGVFVAKFLNIGKGFIFTANAPITGESPSILDIFLGIIPDNPIAAMANGKVVSVIAFALFVSIAVIIETNKNESAVKPFKDFISATLVIMFRITKIVISFTPYGVFALISNVVGQNGISTFMPLSKFILAVYLGCILHMVFTYGTLLSINKINPLRFFKAIFPAQLLAFTTQSSFGTLPVTLKCLIDRVRVSPKIANFTAPLGATMGLNACGGIYPAIAAIFAANVFNIELTVSQIILIIVASTIASLGLAGVPGSVTISATVVLSTLNLPIEIIGVVFGVDIIMDMIRTATNVTGVCVVSTLVAKSKKEFNKEAFYNEEFKEIN